MMKKIKKKQLVYGSECFAGLHETLLATFKRGIMAWFGQIIRLVQK